MIHSDVVYDKLACTALIRRLLAGMLKGEQYFLGCGTDAVCPRGNSDAFTVDKYAVLGIGPLKAVGVVFGIAGVELMSCDGLTAKPLGLASVGVSGAMDV